jgi:hypothetical protein
VFTLSHKAAGRACSDDENAHGWQEARCLHAAIMGASENTDAKYTIIPKKIEMGKAGSAF